MDATTNQSNPPGAQIKVKQLVPWILFLIFFAVLNETVFNVSTPKIAEQFSLGSANVSWMMTIFMVLFGIGAVIYGKLADIYSLRTLITIGVALYAAGSIIGFALQFSYPLVVLGRAIQGAGASAIPALIFVVVARYFPDASRGQVFGLITAVVSLSIGLGPVIGGFVSSSLHWSFLFLIPLLTVAALPFIWKILPAEPRGEGKLDILGAFLVALIVGSLVVFLNVGAWPWLAALGLLTGTAILHFRSAKEPFIDASLFANRKFRSGVVVGFILFSVVIGILFLVPLMLHQVHGLDTAGIGLILFPGAISSVFFGPLGGRLADKKGNSFVVALGLGLLVFSLVGMAVLMPLSPWVVCGALLFTYVGFSLFQTALVNSVSQTLPNSQTGVGMGLFNLISIISGALGTAVVGKILDSGNLGLALLPRLGGAAGQVFSNLLAIFALIVVAGGLWYLRSYRASPTAAKPGAPLEACLDCE